MLADFFAGGGRSARRAGGRPWLHSGGSSPVYLVPLWALFSEVRSRMGWALLSFKVWSSGLSGALLPWSSSFWRCQVTRICTPLLGPIFWKRYWIVPSHQIQSPLWSLRKAAGPSRLFRVLSTLQVGAVLVAGGRMMRMLSLCLAGGSGGLRGVWRLLPCRLSWFAGGWGRRRLFSVPLAWMGLEGVGLGGLGLEEGVRSLLALVP